MSSQLHIFLLSDAKEDFKIKQIQNDADLKEFVEKKVPQFYCCKQYLENVIKDNVACFRKNGRPLIKYKLMEKVLKK